MNVNDQFKRIFDKVEQLTFSEINTLLLMRYADEACTLAVKKNSFVYSNLILPQITRLKEVQIRPLLDKNIFPKEKRQRFYDLKNSLKSNLKQCIH